MAAAFTLAELSPFSSSGQTARGRLVDRDIASSSTLFWGDFQGGCSGSGHEPKISENPCYFTDRPLMRLRL